MVSFPELDDNGTKRDSPLDPELKGLLFYAADGYMSVSIIRRLAAVPSDSEVSLQHHYMIYAGTWRHVDNQVIHTITAAQGPSMGEYGTGPRRHIERRPAHAFGPVAR
ncbi:MAG TPA: lipocalin-like domain-containing protein [Mycobacterium sp.]|nr:lipocalin-like domain-containing protein [Mycobacterium sp.]